MYSDQPIYSIQVFSKCRPSLVGCAEHHAMILDLPKLPKPNPVLCHAIFSLDLLFLDLMTLQLV